MSMVKDLLLLLVAIMHISLMVSNPVGPQSCNEKLRRLVKANKENFSDLLEDLKYAENEYVEHIFHNTTREMKTKGLKPLEGITIPAGNINDSNILTSMHEISECLTSYLPKVIGNLTTHKDVKANILSYTRPFLTFFKKLATTMGNCWKEGELKVCPKHFANNLNQYELKEYGLDVLHTAVKWTESCIQ